MGGASGSQRVSHVTEPKFLTSASNWAKGSYQIAPCSGSQISAATARGRGEASFPGAGATGYRRGGAREGGGLWGV